MSIDSEPIFEGVTEGGTNEDEGDVFNEGVFIFISFEERSRRGIR
jgi:hypothetical protein